MAKGMGYLVIISLFLSPLSPPLFLIKVFGRENGKRKGERGWRFKDFKRFYSPRF